MQAAITEALSQELHEIDPAWEVRATRAWDLLMMVILELLARVYLEEEPGQVRPKPETISAKVVEDLAIHAYENSVGINRLLEIQQTFFVARESEIPLGERKIIKLLGKSIGVFHHESGWYAIENKCLHAGGPIAEGQLEGNIIRCPWHGFQYDLPNGALLKDPNARLPMYPVEVIEGQIFVKISSIQVGDSPGQ
jgi:nitrite reductase/ring-hydroxylating ferredoxin subunit